MSLWSPTRTTVIDQQCVVHHYIRTLGRMPTPEELQRALQARAASELVAVVPAPRQPATLPARVRREVARLVARW